jgi:HD-GYP domain-containing protein (c-di-GMP phosphodiesterase class II)
MVNLCDEDDVTLLGLTCIKSLEDYVLTHAVNVTILSVALARAAQLPKRDVEHVGVAALLHDVGQIDVPQEVLQSAESLTEEEWGSIRRHTLHGALRLLEAGPLEFTAPAALAALEHHLGMWGDGYPKLPSGWSPSLASRIIQIADTYDALTSRRVYRQHPVRPDRVLAYMLENAGMRFDPVLVKLFVTILGLYPPGTAVELDEGSIGIVVRPNRETSLLHRPQVCVLLDGEGKPVEEDPIVDLAETERGIARCVEAEALELAPAAIFLPGA